MSLASPTVRTGPATARAAVVAALSSAGLHATPYAPDSPTPGAAWPQLAVTNWNGHVCDPARYTFDAYVVVNGSDPETTIAAADEVIATVPAALETVATVQTAEPVLITFGDQTTMPGIRFRVVTRA